MLLYIFFLPPVFSTLPPISHDSSHTKLIKGFDSRDFFLSLAGRISYTTFG